MDIEAYRQQAIAKQPQHRHFLNWLKKQKPKDLDLVAQKCHEEVFEEINCLNCANCCKTTGPLFTDKDIDRISAYLKIKPSKFIEKYLIQDEDKDMILNSLPCPFLDSENFCLIYPVRPKACAEYPHTDRRRFYQINELTLKNTLICPAAFEIVEKIKNSYQKH